MFEIGNYLKSNKTKRIIQVLNMKNQRSDRFKAIIIFEPGFKFNVGDVASNWIKDSNKWIHLKYYDSPLWKAINME